MKIFGADLPSLIFGTVGSTRLLALALTASQASAQDYFEPNQAEFTVATPTTYQQIWSKVAIDSSGTFLAYAWCSGQDVYVRFFLPDGTPRTDAIRCNPTLDAFTQDEPAVSIDANGRTLVAWSDRNGYDGEIMGIFATLFDTNGSVLRSEFQVNVVGAESQWRPLIRPMPGGGFLVAWTGEWDGDSFFRLFRSNGMPLTGDVRVNVHQNGAQVDAAPAVAPNGTIFIAFVDFSAYGSVGTGTNVWGRLFNSAGLPLTGEFHLATGRSDGDQREPRAIADRLGNFFVVWEDDTNDGNGWGTFGRTFQSSGAPLTSVFRVHAATAGHQRSPDVATTGERNFIVTWHDDRNGTDDVFAQRIDVHGARIGAEVPISSPGTPGDQYRASVASTADGRMLAFGWEGDGNSIDAFGRLFSQIPLPTLYCTGKTTSQGRVPFLTFSGQPSAANKNATAFRIEAHDLVPNEYGLLIYGYQKADLDFHGGKLCVKSPFVKSLPLKQAASDGTFFRNFNNIIAAGNDPMLTAGQAIAAQIRQVDPSNTIGGFADNMTGGMRFTITP